MLKETFETICSLVLILVFAFGISAIPVYLEHGPQVFTDPERFFSEREGYPVCWGGCDK